MSITKKFLPAVAGLTVLASAVSARAEIDFKPYGAAQYRFREHISTTTPREGDATTTNMYANYFGWRIGTRVKANEQVGLQFQIGNDWSYGERVNWINNQFAIADESNDVRSPFQNLYVHLANFKWDPGFMFVEAGVVGVPDGNGALSLLERSISYNNYGNAAYFGWSPTSNASLMGIRVGAPIIADGDFKIRAELLQSVVNTRIGNDEKSNPSSPLFVFNLPVEFGAFKVTPEFIGVVNRNYNQATEKGDHEMIGGMGLSYKVNDGVTVTAQGAYGTVSNDYSRVGEYGATYSVPEKATDPHPNVSGSIPKGSSDEADAYNSKGILAGVNATIKAGPGNVFVDFKYNNAKNDYVDASNTHFIGSLVQYAWKVYPNFSITPRYRNFYNIYDDDAANKSIVQHRFELFFDGSF